MGTSLPDISNIAMPQEEEALAEALADLDRKLAAYAAAVHEADARLRETARPSQAPATDETPPEPKATVPPETTANGRVPPQRLRDVAGHAPAPKQPTPTEPAAATPETPAAPPAAPTEEETLLASLDESTSKAVRVLRRLNPNKSLQELLKQVEERKDAPGHAAKPTGKSWFRRG
jgi:hypothetical protein